MINGWFTKTARADLSAFPYLLKLIINELHLLKQKYNETHRHSTPLLQVLTPSTYNIAL